MPTYCFHCCGCWSEFEARRRVAERDDPIACPACGTAAVREFKPCAIRQPCDGWAELTRQDFLPERKAERSHFQVPDWKG